MQAGAEFPPVTLAHIDGSLYLVDGWHRVAAALANNQYLIWADVSKMTFDEARWYAAKANTEHGLPLKAKELRDVFRAFIETNRHMQGQKLMPYREIAKRIGKGFSTIRNWMKADYPRLFEKYQQMANGTPDDTDFDREAKMMERRLTKAEADIRNVRNTGRTLDPENLGKLIYVLRETLGDLETKPYEPVEFAVDF
jgi:transposase